MHNDTNNTNISASANEQTKLRFFDGTCRKGDIWFVTDGNSKTTGNEIWSNRPAVIVSNEGFNAKAGFVTVVYLTTSNKSDRPYHVPVLSGGKEATALCEQTPPVDKSRLSFYMGHLTDEEIADIDKAILFMHNISNSLKPNSLFQKWMNAIERYNIDLSENPNDETDGTDAVQPSASDNNMIEELTRQRDQYKMLYETSQQTIMNLMQMQNAYC